MPDNETARRDQRGMSRRQLIQASVAAGAAAWAAPVIIDSLASPAGAVTRACPKGSKAYVLLYSPPGTTAGSDPVRDRPADYGNSFNVPGDTLCLVQSPVCPPGNLPAVWTTMFNVSMTVTGPLISHYIDVASPGAVTITLAADSCCNISNVQAHVHRYAAATNPDCPTPYCQTATAGGTYLQVTAGGYGTKTVTVKPVGTNVCTSPSSPIHWGSPNTDADCGTTGTQTSGQPYGYMVVELNCL